jgi:hypothetical protein
MEEGKIATAWAQFDAVKKSIHVYKNACATLGFFVSVGQVGINFSSF